MEILQTKAQSNTGFEVLGAGDTLVHLITTTDVVTREVKVNTALLILEGNRIPGAFSACLFSANYCCFLPVISTYEFQRKNAVPAN